jgi:hypothetical protein
MFAPCCLAAPQRSQERGESTRRAPLGVSAVRRARRGPGLFGCSGAARGAPRGRSFEVIVVVCSLHGSTQDTPWLTSMTPTLRLVILALRPPIPCNARPCARTASSCSNLDLARLLKCQLPKLANTDTPKYIW